MLHRLQDLMHTGYGKIIISVLLGIGLASIFRKSCKDTDCFTFRGPTPTDVEKKTYKHGGDCYKFKAETKNCSADNPIRFA